MIKDINTPDGPKEMLLGYEALKTIVALQKTEKDEWERLEEIALLGFNTMEKRKSEPLTTKKQMLEWFDDPKIFMEIQKAITTFSENFSEKESPKA